jgi:ATP-dependent RNA helicase RhlE
VLILEPTRELAAQVETAIRDYSRFTDLKTTVVFGGVGYGKQNDELKAGTDTVVATPGRLLDHLEQGTFRLDKVEFLVLDEADRMLDMGFLPDVRGTSWKNVRARGTPRFFPPPFRRRSKRSSNGRCTVPKPLRSARAARRRNRQARHLSRFRHAKNRSAARIAQARELQFRPRFLPHETRRRSRRRTAQARQSRRRRAAFQPHATRARTGLARFSRGQIRSARRHRHRRARLDIADVSHVINYDVPQHPEDYIHRIGRTGRAEASGDAFTIMVAEDAPHVYSIERFISQKIPRVKLENFDYRYTALFEEAKPGAAAGGFPGKVRGGRVHGGYHFAPGGRRR